MRGAIALNPPEIEGQKYRDRVYHKLCGIILAA